jgi:hypothetical protein
LIVFLLCPIAFTEDDVPYVLFEFARILQGFLDVDEIVLSFEVRIM